MLPFEPESLPDRITLLNQKRVLNQKKRLEPKRDV
jgi:hypothetical protein